MHSSTRSQNYLPENVRLYLELTRLLDGIQRAHPEVSAPLRLTLLRARRDGQLGSLDQRRFRTLVADARMPPQGTHRDNPSEQHHHPLVR